MGPHHTSPSHRTLTVLTTFLVVASLVVSLFPSAMAHIDEEDAFNVTESRHDVAITSPSSGAVFGGETPITIEWNYGNYSESSDGSRDCQITITDTSTGALLHSTNKSCTESGETGKIVTWSVSEQAEFDVDSNAVEISVTLEEESGDDATGSGSDTDTRTITLDTVPPKLSSPMVEVDGTFEPLSSSGVHWTDTGTVRVSIDDATLTNARINHTISSPLASASGAWQANFKNLSYDHGDEITFHFAAKDEFRWNRLPGIPGTYMVGIDLFGPETTDLNLTAADHGTTVDGDTWVAGQFTLSNSTHDDHSGVASVTVVREDTLGLTDVKSVTGDPVIVDTTDVSEWSPTGGYGPFTLGYRTQDGVANVNWTGTGLNETIFVDNRAPTASLTSAGTVSTAEPTVAFEITDDGVGLDVASLTLEHQAPGEAFTQVSVADWTNSTSPTTDFTWTPADSLVNGAHTFRVTVQDNLTNELVDDTLQVTVDDKPPTISSLTLDSPDRVQQAADLNLTLDADDPSGLDRVEVNLSQGGTTQWTGTYALDGPTSVSGEPVTVRLGNVSDPSVPFPALGQYKVFVTVLDVYNRSTTTEVTPPDDLNVTPRMHVVDPVNLTGGIVHTNVTAGIVSSTTPDGGSCTSDDICTLSELEVEYRDPNGDWQPLTTRSIPDPTNPDGSTGLYTYPIVVNLTQAGIDEADFSQNGFVRFTAHADYADTGDRFQTVATEFVQGAGGFDVIEPAAGEVNATGNITFRVQVTNLPPELHEDDARVAIELQGVSNSFTGLLEAPQDGNGDPTGTGLHELNVRDLTGGALLARDPYTVTYTLVNETTDEAYTTRTIPFTVETRAPQVEILESTFHDDGQNRWIGSQVNLSVNITTDFADLNGIGNVSVLFFKDSAGWVVAPEVTWHPWNSTQTLPPKDESNGEGDGFYQLNATVTTPEVISHGQTVKLFVNATNNANGTASGASGRKGFNSVIVKLDERAPTVSLQANTSATLGRTNHNVSLVEQQKLLVNISDQGAGLLEDGAEPKGITLVEAALFRTNGTTTWFWNGSTNGEWVVLDGDTDRWYDLDFAYNATSAKGRIWQATDADLDGAISAMEDALAMNYTVRVRASDLAGNTALTTSIPLVPDAGAPLVEDLTVDEEPSSFEDTATITATVTEDNWDAWTALQSRQNLTVVVEDPNGDVHRYNASSVTGSGAERTVTWSLQGEATTFVGNYTVGFEVKDPVGNVNTSLSTNGTFLDPVHFDVPDDDFPAFDYMALEPTPPAPDTPLFAQVKAFDSSGIANATTWWWLGSDKANTTVGPFDMTCEPAEDEDDPRWVLCELANSDGPNLDLEPGESVFFNVTLEDEVGKTIDIGDEGEIVSDNAPPIVRKEHPPADVTWINATTTVQISIFDRNLDTDTVEVTTGVDQGNLTTADVPLDPAGNDTFLLNLTPTGLDDGDQWVVRVSAEDDQGSNTTRTWTFQVDTGAPTVTHTFQDAYVDAANRTWLSGSSTITLTGEDAGSGVDEGDISYRIGSGSSWTTYTGAFALPDSAVGETTIHVEVVDVAGNGNTTSFTVHADPGAPRVSLIEKDGRTVRAQVLDDGVGLNRSAITLLYTLEGSSDFDTVAMTNPLDNMWEASVPSSIRGRIQFYVEARDLVGNVGQLGTASTPLNLTTGNNPPSLSVSNPTSGATVKGDLSIAWTATDPDGDALTVSFALESEDGSLQELGQAPRSSKSATVDVSGVADGDYTLLVRAGDGTVETTERIPVFVLNTDVVQPVNTPTSSTTAGDPITVEVDVSHPFKTVSKVTAIIERNGQPVEEVEMTDEGEGRYSLTYEPSEPGDYSVSIVVAYDDGSQDAPFQVASFNSAAPGSSGISPQILTLVALAAIAVILGAYAAFGRWDT